MKIRAKEQLAIARIQKGLTINELAEISKVPNATISRTENGGFISVKSATKLVKALNQDFEKLFLVEKE